jgi:serine/threonine protein kinase
VSEPPIFNLHSAVIILLKGEEPFRKGYFNYMEEQQSELTVPTLKLALEKKIVSQKDIENCRDLVKKSKKIGLETTLEEVLLKQNLITQEQLQELKHLSQITDGGKMFGSYRLGRMIGQGGMGKVYEAVQEVMGRNVAIKVMNTQLGDDTTHVPRFYQEIRALAKLSHPNIVAIFDAGKINRRHFFAMELLPGPSLKEHIDAKKCLPEHEALEIIKATAKALGHAHEQNVIHRDVKPENIIFNEAKVPKLTDFGVVMHHDMDHMTLTQEGYLVGSFYYSSPEQVNGSRDLDGRSDIYSLGATLYYALTGRPVHNGTTPQEVLAKHLAGKYTSPRKLNPAVSKRTVRIVAKMMAVNRDKRFASMQEVVEAIECPSWWKKFILAGSVAIAGLLFLALGILIERLLHL